jgi:predicted RNA binding protein YcfA (HicA-like mRNA interferase family)
MSSAQAISLLKDAGFQILRRGRGDHLIMQKESLRIVISHPQQELSSGMTKKVRSFMRKS